jgi:hypothetical protein
MKRSAVVKWASEAEMVASYIAHASAIDRERWWTNPTYQPQTWIAYPETAGWDLVLVRDDGFQIGVEAKLSLNAEVLCQALNQNRSHDGEGPDCWAILVPDYAAVNGLGAIAKHLGIVVVTARPAQSITADEAKWGVYRDERAVKFYPSLPRSDENSGFYGWGTSEWPERCPDSRIKLPDFVPDVAAGVPSPIRLTDWKIKAIKIAVILEKRGYVTRADFKAIGIDMSRWTQGRWLRPSDAIRGRWEKGREYPNLRAQHPVNFVQIEEASSKWLPPGTTLEAASAPPLFDGVAA